MYIGISRYLPACSPVLFIIRFFCYLPISFLLGLVFYSLSSAQPLQDAVKPESTSLTRQEIEELKSQVEKTYKLEVEGCYQKFDVNNCKKDASQKKYKELSKLRLQDLALKSKERAQRAEQLEKEAQQKALDNERSQQEKKAQANIDYQNRLKENQEKNDHFNAKSKPLTSQSGGVEGRGATSTPETESRAQYDAKQREAIQHKQEVLEKLKEKEKSKPQSKPSSSVSGASN